MLSVIRAELRESPSRHRPFLGSQLLGGNPFTTLFYKRSYLKKILHKCDLRLIEDASPDDGAVSNPDQMDFKGHGCRLISAEGVTLPFLKR